MNIDTRIEADMDVDVFLLMYYRPSTVVMTDHCYLHIKLKLAIGFTGSGHDHKGSTVKSVLARTIPPIYRR